MSTYRSASHTFQCVGVQPAFLLSPQCRPIITMQGMHRLHSIVYRSATDTLLDAGVQADQTVNRMHRRRSPIAGAQPRMLPDPGAQAAVAEHGEGG